VAFAAQRLAGETHWREAVPEVLAGLGQAARASRAFVFENDLDEHGRNAAWERFEWTAPGVAPLIDDPARQGAPWEESGFGTWAATLGSGNELVGRIEDLLAEPGRPFERDVGSVAVVPLFAAGRWWGTIGFDDREGERAWGQPELDALRTVASTLGAAIERERAGDRLIEAESLHRALVEQIPALTYLDVLDGGDRSVYVSPQIRTLLGYEPEDWLADDEFWRKHLHPDDAEAIWAEWRRRIDAGEPFSAEYRMLRSDGSTTWVSEQASVVPGENGGPAVMQGVIMDVSERKRDQDLLRQAETKYRALVENVPVLIYAEAIVPSLENFYISPQVTRMLGYTPQEWTSRRGFWREHLHPDDRDRVLAANAEADETQNHFVTEYRFRAKDGRWVWLHDEAALVHDEEGVPAYWQGCMIDVTERIHAENALAEAESRLRTLVEHIPAVTYVQAHDGEASSFYISPQVEATFGYPANAWADPTFWIAHVHPNDRGWVDLEDRRTDETGDPVEMEYRLLAADGRYRWVRDEAVLLFDKEGHPTFWQGFLVDITERKHAEEALEHALSVEREAGRRLRAVDEMKNTFLRAVSHDLRTPLAAILGLAVTLGDENVVLQEGEARELAGRIERNARKLERLVTDLLDLDRLSRGIVEPVRQPVEVAGLLHSVVAGSDLVADPPVHVLAEPLEVELDAAKVERILENLLANAARHTPPGTRVWVRAEPFDDGVLICVEDEGPGVPEEERETIFEPFHQGSGAPAHAPGAGVGLALVTRFAQIHGGRAWVEEREGGGASFRVFLPGSDGGPRPEQDEPRSQTG
jgi:PAS domain S-box-containing protein